MEMIVLAEDNGDAEAVSEALRVAQADRLNTDFQPYGIEFDINIAVKNDTCFRYMCSSNSAYSLTCDTGERIFSGLNLCCDSANPVTGCDFEDYQDVIMKNKYAVDDKLNVFITAQPTGDYAIYPWDSRAPTKTGGVMKLTSGVGSTNCPGNHCVWLTHEVEHALGLWHTFESSADECEGGCRERAICTGNVECEECDHVGDFCCDTPSGLGAGACASGEGLGTDPCSDGAEFPATDYTNYMDYGGDGCANHFTSHQAKRMHCWTCDAVPGWIDSPDCNSNDIPDVCEITRGDKDDCDANGVPDDCQPDCNNNFVADVCDIAEQISNDCDGNGVPDECHSSTQQRACCHDGDQCTVMTELCCDELSGVFVEEQSTCL